MATRSTRNRRGAVRRLTYTPDDLTQFIVPSDARISPDGAQVLFTRKHVGEKNDYATNLWIAPADGGEPRAFTSGDKDTHGRWSPDGATIAFTSGRVKGQSQIYTIPATGGEARALTSFPEGRIAGFRWSPDGSCLAVKFREADPDWTQAAAKAREEKGLSEPARVLDDWWYRLDGDGYFNAQRFQLFIVDVASGTHRRLYDKDTLGDFTFDFSPDGRKIAATTNRDRRALASPWKDEIILIDVKSGRLRPIAGFPEGPKGEVRWSPDGRMLAWAGRLGGEDGLYSTDNIELFVGDPKTGKARSLTGREDYCLMSVALGDIAEASFSPSIEWSRDSKRVFFRLGHHGEMHIASVRRSGGAVELHTRGHAVHDLGTMDDAGRRMALVRYTTTNLPEVHVADLDAPNLAPRAVTHFNAPLQKARQASKITSQWITTADGTKVHTWVMMPPHHTSGSRKKYPAVLEIHGGPHAQYGVGFFHEFQCLAAAGYVVVFSNPRGSKGYGRDHCHAIRGQWGTADWVDIQAVTDFMTNHPNIDAGRMGVMGGSYGGYMTNWVIGHTNVFAGAITDRCVSNLVTMGGTSDYPDMPDRYFPGNFWDRPEARWEQSPIRHFGNVRTPTLIIHSEGDLRCNVEQSEQVFMALKIRNVPCRFVRYPRSTSHGMSRSGPPD
ncbi:MAG: S9 family peptidase, partial [Phycisphaerales bacterium]|nr:S9 family peptidase [Phycisphaerales bacterium]